MKTNLENWNLFTNKPGIQAYPALEVDTYNMYCNRLVTCDVTGGIDSASCALIVSSMCHMIVFAVDEEDNQASYSFLCTSSGIFMYQLPIS